MRAGERVLVATVAVALVAAGCLGGPAPEAAGSTGTETAGVTPTETPRFDYERTTVVATDGGTRLATVDARVADTAEKRFVGLSETESLTPGEGMWFVHPTEERQAYVMRGMSFPLDIVFVAADGTVTAVYHADVDGTNAPYEARAKYVLEVKRGWANRTGVAVGDRVLPASASETD